MVLINITLIGLIGFEKKTHVPPLNALLTKMVRKLERALLAPLLSEHASMSDHCG